MIKSNAIKFLFCLFIILLACQPFEEQEIEPILTIERINVADDTFLQKLLNDNIGNTSNGRTLESSVGDIDLNEAIKVDNPELNTTKYSLLVKDDMTNGAFSNVVFQITNGWLYQYKITYFPESEWIQNGKDWGQYSGSISVYNMNDGLVSSKYLQNGASVSSNSGRVQSGDDCYDCDFYLSYGEVPHLNYVGQATLIIDCEPPNSSTSQRIATCHEIIGAPVPSDGDGDPWTPPEDDTVGTAPDWGIEDDGGGPAGVLEETTCDPGKTLNELGVCTCLYGADENGCMSEADAWEEDKICYDESFTSNPCISNAWDKLLQSSVVFEMLSNLIDESAVAEVCFSVQDSVTHQGQPVNGTTNGGSFPISITISASSAADRPEIAVARTLLHEMIHAEMFRKILSVDGQSGLSPDNFPGIFDYYSRYLPIFKEDGTWWYPDGSPQHNLMAQHYLRQMTRALMQFDGVDPDNFLLEPMYEALAWNALHETTVYQGLSTFEINSIKTLIGQLLSDRAKCN